MAEFRVDPENLIAPGRYALVCSFPDVTGPGADPHFSKGMLAEFDVK